MSETMVYRHTLYDSIDAIEPDAWNSLRRGERDPFMDLRLLRAVERSMCGGSRFRYVLFRDDSGTPVASACLSSYRVDCALLADGFAKKAIQGIGRVAPILTHLTVVFCGVPFSAGQSNLRLSPDADPGLVLRELDQLLVDFGRQERARCIVFKELTSEECERLAALTELGYLRADSMPMNHTDPSFATFEDYCAHLKSSKRYTLRRSQKKFAESGLRVVQMKGGDGADRVYTEDVHRLYEVIYDKAEVRLEQLPPTLFPEMARHFPDNTAFTFVYQDDRVVAFAASVFTSEVFHQMFVGVDQELNAGCDLYFNLFFHAIDYAYRQHVQDIFVGQSADAFKHQKLGCYQVPLYFFIKGLDIPARFVIRHGHSLLFPPRPLYTAHD